MPTLTSKEAVMERTLPHRSAGVFRWTAAAILALSSWCWAETGKSPASAKIDGRELFLREWVPGDSRAGEGDGLGPVFNDSSCAACHNQGGVGGAGPAEKNVDIITASRGAFGSRHPDEATITKRILRLISEGRTHGEKGSENLEFEAHQVSSQESDESREALGKIHPGFLTQESVVLHHFAVDPGYQEWRARFFIRQRFQRNPIALFGAGLIDSVPESALLEAAERKHDRFPEVSGRVSRLEGGRVGRFGWKAQESTLDGFVRTACAVELGLHVPGRPQSGLPSKPDRRAPGYDLREEEVTALISYLAELPRPVERRPSSGPELMLVEEGEAHFRDIGCAACHAPTLGEVKGLYSDLLLHDMGSEMADQGSYGDFSPDLAGAAKAGGSLPPLETDGVTVVRSRGKRNGRSEWRTPPLWGVRDSAPYLHDGRARNLETAIALHGGEGKPSARRYFKLPSERRLALQTFLKSLSAP